MEMLWSLLAGFGLSAACGFRVFIPLLVTSAASLSGYLPLSERFAWIGSWPALVVFATATCLEIAAYYLPWIDNLLDSIAAPAAVVAGTVIMASRFSDMSPLVVWPMALIAGGGSAGLVQTLTSSARVTSTAATGGIGNPVLSTIEAAASIILSILSVVIPVIAFVATLAIVIFIYRKIRSWRRGKAEAVSG